MRNRFLKAIYYDFDGHIDAHPRIIRFFSEQIIGHSGKAHAKKLQFREAFDWCSTTKYY